jgi:23S rRNA (guanosine2251-2'-O)-methyltransferase
MKSPKDTARTGPFAHAPRLVLGLQPVREAIRVHGERLGRVMVERGGGDKSRLDALARFAGDHRVADVRRVARRELDQVAGGVYHQGVAAWAPELSLAAPDTVLSAPDLLCVALDGIQDPQNFGAVVRSAVGFGATAIVWPEHASAPLTPATFRASAGAIEHATLCRVPSLSRFLDDARAVGTAIIGLSPEGSATLAELDLIGPLVIVIGAEHEGIASAVRKRCTGFVRLTLAGPVASLNASVAAGIALHAALVQRAKSVTSERH